MDNTKKHGALSVIGTFLKNHVMYLVLVVLMIFFATQSEKFLTASNLRNIVNQSAYQLIVGIGVAFIMISGAMDLSIGYEMSLAGVVMGQMLTHGVAIPFVILAGIAACVLMNLLNCALFVKLKVFPFILTLATQYLFMGLSYIISGSQTFIGFSSEFKAIGQGYVGPIPIAVIIMVAAVLFASFVLNRTHFGRHIYAVGGNPEAAMLAGINVTKTRFLVYTVAGFFIGLGTLILISRSGSSASSVGPGTEFTVLAGGILGGIAIQGGQGKINCMVVGVLILTVLSNGMQLMQLGIYPQYVAKGIVLVVAIGFDTLQKMGVIRRSKLVPGSEPATVSSDAE